MNQPRRETFLDQLEVRHGPPQLFARFFLRAVQEVEARNVTLEFASFEELERINQQHRDGWRPLLSSFQPGLGGASKANGFVLVGRNQHGDPVATQAIRIFDMRNSNVKIAAERLSLLYANPDRDKLPGESCVVTAPDAESISGYVSLGGAVWYRPDFRRLQLADLLPRISRVLCTAHYNVDNHIALYSKENIAKALHTRGGFKSASESITLCNSRSFPEGHLEMSLCRMTPTDIIDDAFGWLMNWRSKIDTQVETRRA
jgi:hypothetical protein